MPETGEKKFYGIASQATAKDILSKVADTKTTVDTLGTDVPTIKTGVSDLQTVLTTMQTDVGTVKTDLADVKTKVTANTEAIAAIKTTVDDHTAKLEGLGTSMTALSDKVEAVAGSGQYIITDDGTKWAYHFDATEGVMGFLEVTEPETTPGTRNN